MAKNKQRFYCRKWQILRFILKPRQCKKFRVLKRSNGMAAIPKKRLGKQNLWTEEKHSCHSPKII